MPRRPRRPVPCSASRPAGSGKTTTLVARVAWLIASGTATPAEIAAITFNTRAAEELRERLASALAPLDVEAGAVRVRTFHALGLEILRDSGAVVEPLVDRMAILRRVAPAAGPAGWRALDTAISRLKLDLGVTADQVAADAEAGPTARTFVAYERAVAATGGLDFDDLVARALRAPRDRRRRSSGGGGRRCGHLLVDEAQDLDRAQLRLALLLAAPANRVFFVGDDDQSIYGWRLADVRRVLSLADALPGLRRVDLVVNYRCPPTVVGRAVRLVEHNRERFAKTIRAGPAATGSIVLAPRLERRDGPDRAGRRRLAATTTRRGRSSPGRTASCCRRSPSASTGASRSGHRPRSSSSARRSSTARSTRRSATDAHAAAARPARGGAPGVGGRSSGDGDRCRAGPRRPAAGRHRRAPSSPGPCRSRRSPTSGPRSRNDGPRSPSCAATTRR